MKLIFLEEVEFAWGEWGFREEAQFSDEAFETGTGGRGDGRHGETVAFFDAAHHDEDGFDGAGAGFPEVGLHEMEELAVKLACGGPVVVEGGLDHGGHFAGNLIGCDRDKAGAADGDGAEGHDVVTGVDLEGTGRAGGELADLGHVAGGFLNAGDVGVGFDEAEDGGWLKIGAGAAGYVVKDDGQLSGACDGGKVLELALLRGLVVVGIGAEDGGNAGDAGGEAGAFFCAAGGIVRTAGPDGDAAIGGLGDDAEDAEPFLVGEGRRFRSGAAGDEPVDAAGDLPLDEVL